MTIIVSKENKHATKLKRTFIDREDYLQLYIHNNPEVIHIYETRQLVKRRDTLFGMERGL